MEYTNVVNAWALSLLGAARTTELARREGRGEGTGLGGRGSGGKLRHDEPRNGGDFLGLRSWTPGDENLRAQGWHRRFDSLVAQVTNRAGFRTGIDVAVPDLAQRHPDDERQDGNRDNEAPCRISN